MLAAYESTDGVQGEPPSAVRGASQDRPQLHVFLHPHCPCSRATVAELERLLLAAGAQRPDTTVHVFAPRDEPEAWSRSALWDAAAAIPGVEVLADADGRRAATFGARTSGQALLYAADGELLFQGGLTGGRGHEGDNAGRSAALRQLREHAPAAVRFPVFGCVIQGREGGS